MTREEFIEILEEKGYDYHNEGERIIVDHKRAVWLNNLTSLPAGVQFRNGGYVWLDSLTSLPAGVQFKNEGNVWLDYLTSLPADVQFKNEGYVSLYSLRSLPSGVQFNNRGKVSLDSLTSLPADVQFNNEGWISLPSLKSFNLEDLDYTFQNLGSIYIERLNIEEVEFPESRWVPVKPRRVKTFESFSYCL